MINTKNTAKIRRAGRRGYALAAVVALIFLLTTILGVIINHVGYSSWVMEAYSNRFHARNTLESMTNLSLKWLLAEVESGLRPRAQAIVTMEYLTNFDSLRIFATIDFEGGKATIYDLDYMPEKIVKPIDMSRIFPPSLPGGYMIRAVVERKGLAPLMLESVYVVTLSTLPGGDVVEILDENPVYSRELFRRILN